MEIDVMGSYNTVKAVLPHLEASAKKHSRPPPADLPQLFSHPARLLFVSATIHYTGIPLQSHVGAAKAAVDALSTSCAIELGPRGITSNVIAPGGIADTEGVARLARKGALQEQAKMTPLGKLGSVKNVADATIWLCSDAGSFINGTVVVGMSSLMQKLD
jgi:2,4-dienoyl-CoA reductase [(3E)-enoyl-CoA-producing], peroxisomal